MKSFKSFPQCLLTIALGFLTQNIIKAASIVVDDSNPDETITITADNFEGGYYVNGVLIQQGLNNPKTITLSEADGAITTSATWIANSGSGSVIYYFVEGDNPTVISDIITANWSTASGFTTLNSVFRSDINNDLGLLPSNLSVTSPNVFVENGEPVTFTLPNFRATIISDVPESSPTIALLLSSFALICFVHRWFRFA